MVTTLKFPKSRLLAATRLLDSLEYGISYVPWVPHPPMVPILSTEIFPIPAITKSYGEVPLYMTDTLVVAQA